MLVFLTIILFILLITPISGIFLWKRSKIISVLCFMPLALLISVPTGWYVAATNHYFIKNTDLSEEQLGGVNLFEPLTDEVIEELGDYELHDSVYHELLEFKHAWMTINEDHEIRSISFNEKGQQTLLGVEVGDPLQKAKDLYGSHYANDFEPCMASWIFYVDRKNNVELEFIYDGEEMIQEIRLSELEQEG